VVSFSKSIAKAVDQSGTSRFFSRFHDAVVYPPSSSYHNIVPCSSHPLSQILCHISSQKEKIELASKDRLVASFPSDYWIMYLVSRTMVGTTTFMRCGTLDKPFDRCVGRRWMLGSEQHILVLSRGK
jgi:hypothetical protein